jgi:hypothetical protein
MNGRMTKLNTANLHDTYTTLRIQVTAYHNMLTINNNLTSLLSKPATLWVTDAGPNLERDNVLPGQVYHTPQWNGWGG